MNKKFLLVFGVITIVMAYIFNTSHAFDNYGITKGNMSIHVLAQDTGSTSGGSSGGSSGSGQDSTTYQVGTKTKTKTVETYTTTAPGWTFSYEVNLWVFKGTVTNTQPPSYKKETDTVLVTIQCCQKQGNLKTCSFESC